MTHQEAISIPAFFTELGLEGGPRNQGVGGDQGAAKGRRLRVTTQRKNRERGAESGGGRRRGRCRSVLAIRHTAACFMARPPSWCCLLIDIKMR